MRLRTLYASWLRLPNGFVADTDGGLCHFGEDGVLALTELPPSTYEYERRRRSLFGKVREPWRRPADEHRNAPLADAYRSQADTLYFWQGGACACLLHAGTEWNWRDRVRFYTAAEAQELGLKREAVAANALYRPLDLRPQAAPSAFPLVQSYIVSPGYLDSLWAEDTRPGYAPIPGFASIDFVRDTSLCRSELAAFAAMPIRFAELIGATFDAARWQAVVEDDELFPYAPEPAALFPFTREGERVAELVLRAGDEACCYPYYDSMAIVLRYAPVLQGEVDTLIAEMFAAHRRILPLAPHLCDVMG